MLNRHRSLKSLCIEEEICLCVVPYPVFVNKERRLRCIFSAMYWIVGDAKNIRRFGRRPKQMRGNGLDFHACNQLAVNKQRCLGRLRQVEDAVFVLHHCIMMPILPSP